MLGLFTWFSKWNFTRHVEMFMLNLLKKFAPYCTLSHDPKGHYMMAQGARKGNKHNNINLTITLH